MNCKHLALSFEHKGKVLRVKINRPEVRNAFNEELIEEFHQVFAAVTQEKGKDFEKVQAILLQGEGAAFCGGGDLKWMKKSLELSKEENLDDCLKLTQMFLAMDRVPVPVIGLVHGFAIEHHFINGVLQRPFDLAEALDDGSPRLPAGAHLIDERFLHTR